MIKLAKLTKESEEKFKKFVKNSELLKLDSNNFITAELQENIKIDETKQFKNKFKLAQYLYKTLKDLDEVTNDIWHFLVIIYSQQLLKKKGEIGSVDRFLISQTYYPFTHLLKPVFDLYHLYSDDEKLIEFLLLNPINESGSLFLETVKRTEIMKNKHFIGVSKKMFYDEGSKTIKSGAIEGIRRLIDLFQQYARSYDLYSMPADKILENLIKKHPEFGEFI